MAYSQGGTIAAADYNGFVGTSPSSTTNTINTVWSVGSGSAGYGQTALTQSASNTGLVTATQWATLINTLNSILTHQSGSGSGISGTITSGQTINYLSTLSTNISTAYTNRLTFASNASVVVGSNQTTAWSSASTINTLTRSFGIRAGFGSGDQARYFFNAGGRLKLNCSATQNASTTARTNAAINLVTYIGGLLLFAANTNGGKSGVGGATTANDTTKGYFTCTYNANVTIVGVTSTTTSYTSDTGTITVIPNGTQGANNDLGPNVDFWLTLNSTSGANAGGLSFDDSLGINVIRSLDVSYPETTNLANTWGAVTITAL